MLAIDCANANHIFLLPESKWRTFSLAHIAYSIINSSHKMCLARCEGTICFCDFILASSCLCRVCCVYRKQYLRRSPKNIKHHIKYHTCSSGFHGCIIDADYLFKILLCASASRSAHVHASWEAPACESQPEVADLSMPTVISHIFARFLVMRGTRQCSHQSLVSRPRPA